MEYQIILYYVSPEVHAVNGKYNFYILFHKFEEFR